MLIIYFNVSNLLNLIPVDGVIYAVLCLLNHISLAGDAFQLSRTSLRLSLSFLELEIYTFLKKCQEIG